MRKILLIIEEHLDTNTADFGCYLARLTQSKVTGVFVENNRKAEAINADAVRETSYAENIESLSLAEVKRRSKPTDQNVDHFINSCSNRGVNCTVIRDQGVPAIEFVKESRFADLIVVSAETSFEGGPTSIPSPFLKKLLSDSECPVIIAPLYFETIDEIYFAYDGSSSAVFALKQFTYLFPELSAKRATVLQISEEPGNKLDSTDKICEYLKQHYSNVGYEVLQGDTGEELFAHLLKKQNAMVVMGAFGRNLLSNFFKRSHADLFIKTSNLPIFISHQ